jgi:hypothetical protein
MEGDVMRIAAIIYFVTGSVYLGWDIFLTFTIGIRIGTLLMAVVAASILYQGYALLNQKRGAWWNAIVTSASLAIVSGYIAYSLAFFSNSSEGFLLMLSETWLTFSVVSIMFITQVSVIALLLLSKPQPIRAT